VVTVAMVTGVDMLKLCIMHSMAYRERLYTRLYNGVWQTWLAYVSDDSDIER
jgi:hypothetical protein